MLFFALALQLASGPQERIEDPQRRPGRYGDRTLLPSGWKLSPVGEQIDLGTLPLNLVLSPDGRYALVTNNGYGEHSIMVIDLASRRVAQKIPQKSLWLGLAFSPDGRRFYASTGHNNEVLVFSFAAGKAEQLAAVRVRMGDGSTAPATPEESGEVASPDQVRPVGGFAAGLAVGPDGRRLYVALNLADEVVEVDTQQLKPVRSVFVGNQPYTCAVSPNGRHLFVTNWGAASVEVIDPRLFTVIRRIPVGDHPNDLVFTPDGRRLLVATANDNRVQVIDAETLQVREQISVALYPRAPAGTTPNGLAVSRDGRRAFVVNADNNDVAVIDLTIVNRSKVLGFIPVGWYPTAVKVSASGEELLVVNGKGLTSKPLPEGPSPNRKHEPGDPYIGILFPGTLSVIKMSNPSWLGEMTRKVIENSPYADSVLGTAPGPSDSVIPNVIGAPSPIKHVIYIIKENRTYDQVFGDMKEGNGDPSLCLFGEEVTPNHHALAREFVLLDNFYADAEVSADGHNWSMGAYATDYVEKTWPTNYSKRGRSYDYEGTKAIAAPSAGYIWDSCLRQGVSFRSYGEFVVTPKQGNKPATTSVPALQDHFDPLYHSFDLDYSDQKRIDRWLTEFREFEQNGNLPQLQIVRLGNDHTSGTKAGSKTPRALVADNDLALGRLVEAVSKSQYWKETTIFVVEDDAQNGPDHVDAHRTVALVIGPYVRRQFVDSTMYSTTSMLRTIELILGLPPMSQFDAAARPMFASFAGQPDPRPYQTRPARVSLSDTNPKGAFGQEKSATFNLEIEDAAPDIELNEIIWRSIKGANSPMPPPVRSVFSSRR